jgi:SH3-like domain-containing protein
LRSALLVAGLPLANSVHAQEEVAYQAYATSALRFREAPSLDGRILAVIPPGGAVRVTECENDWCGVVFRGEAGFAAESFLSRD